MKNLSLLIFCFFLMGQNLVFSQKNLNNYKYVTVPNRFDFLKSPDQYQVNSLTKFLLKKNGFMVLEDSANYPEDLSKNRCLLLYVDVQKLKGFLKTKLEVQFKNCNNEVVYTSATGVSKEKEYKKSYNEALRSAFESIATLNYNYVEQATNMAVAEPEPIAVEAPNPPAVQKPVEVLPTPTIPEERPVKVPVVEVPPIQVHATSYGFEVIDSGSGTILHTLHATIYNGVYLIDNKPGIAYMRGNRWVREYVYRQKIMIEPLF